MAMRRPQTVCLFCQSRQSLVGRRRFAVTATRDLETIATRPEDDGIVLSNKFPGSGSDQGHNAPVLPLIDTVRQWKLHSGIDELREALLGFDALHQRRDLRLEVLRNLSNPWPPAPSGAIQKNKSKTLAQVRLPEANAALIPHTAFRRLVAGAIGDKDIRLIMRVQLLRCVWPNEVLRIMAVAMQDKITARNFAVLAEPVIRALYRCRTNVPDTEVLKAINIIIWRLRSAELHCSQILMHMGLKFAARVRSLPAMKKYLKLLRDSGATMTSNAFRSVIAKFSIGHRGLGEIRNGRWRREQLMQVLKGFEEDVDLPPEQQYHLGTFLRRDDWQYLHGWVTVLARCKDADAVWCEWEMWKQSPARLHPKKLESQSGEMTSRRRGDYWFVEQMTYTGDYKRAWKMVEETGIDFRTLKDRIKMSLLDCAEYATVWDDEMRAMMIKKYDADLTKIEKALGVQWVASGEEEGEGTHELFGDQEAALEKLGSDDWKLEEDFGFPYFDDKAIVPEQEERALHDAEEEGLAEGDATQ